METKTTLSSALAELQKYPINAKKTGTNPHFKSDYATLEDCWEACRKPLADAGLVVTQEMGSSENGKDYVATKVTHVESREYYKGAVPIVGATDMQKLGSAITYARRYGLITMVGILTGDDDDGNAAATVDVPTDKQITFVETLLKQRAVPNEVETAIKTKLTDHAFTKDSITTVIDKLQEYPEAK